MKTRPGAGDSPTEGRRRGGKRSREWSLGVSLATVGVGVIISATVNPLFGRAVHWDWMAVVAPAVFVALALALRNRWA